MDCVPTGFKVLGQIMDLSMTVMAWRDAIVCSGCQNLVHLHLAVFMAFIRPAVLEETATATAAVVVGFVGGHVNEVFFPDHCLDYKPEVFGHRISKGFSYQLAGILNRKLDLKVFVPIGICLESSFLDPFCIELNDTDNLELVFDVEFFQSGPDCE